MIFFNRNVKFLRLRRGRTQKDLAESLGLKRTTVNALENAISQPTVIQLQLYSRYFRLAIDSLINVDMERLAESQLTDLENGFDVYIKGTGIRVLTVAVTPDNDDTIELVPEKAKAGYATGYSDPEYIGALPLLQLPFLSNNKKYRAFPISGDSMLPIPDGSIVVGEYVDDFLNIPSGQACILLLRSEGIVFKLVDNCIASSDSLRLTSMNLLYDPYDVHIADVVEVWRFACFVSYALPDFSSNDSAMLSALKNVVAGVDELKARTGIAK